MFWTVLYQIKSPENAGMLVRAHVAFGGARIVVVGPDPLHLTKRAQAFSRRLERLTEFVHCSDDDAFFAWCEAEQVTPIAVEIASPTTFLPGYRFPERTALIIGSEARGIPDDVLARCAGIVTIPQHGPVACLNAAVAGCLAMYELIRSLPVTRRIEGSEYIVEESNAPSPLPTDIE
jgi:tRNA G18 (ribose-2'-O)-methylase SpoU